MSDSTLMVHLVEEHLDHRRRLGFQLHIVGQMLMEFARYAGRTSGPTPPPSSTLAGRPGRTSSKKRAYWGSMHSGAHRSASVNARARCAIRHRETLGGPRPGAAVDSGSLHDEFILQNPGARSLSMLWMSRPVFDRTRRDSIQPPAVPCVWKGDYALFTGPFLEVEDDDHHVYRRGAPLEICSKTVAVLESSSYRRHFAVINRASMSEQTSVKETSCSSTGSCC